MLASKQYKKIPNSGKAALNAFADDKNKNKLFDHINADINRQNTINSQAVRRSTYRGLLRKYFDMSNADMTPIEASEDAKQEYFEERNAALDNQTITVFNKKILNKLNTIQIMKLLMTSGLRIGELLENEARIQKDKFGKDFIEFKLNKKGNDAFYKIYTLIPPDQWWRLYEQMKAVTANSNTQYIIININKQLKNILPENAYKKSTHVARAIYVAYIAKFVEPIKTMPYVIKKYLNHANDKSSVHYQHVKLRGNVKNFFDMTPEAEEKQEITERPNKRAPIEDKIVWIDQFYRPNISKLELMRLSRYGKITINRYLESRA